MPQASLTDFYSWSRNFTVGHETFTVGHETYRCCPVCTYLSFITDCKSFVTNCKNYMTDRKSFMTDCKSFVTNRKSENSACKFCQLLQSVTIARVAIRLTVTRGGFKSISYAPRGAYEINNSVFIHPPGGVWRGGRMKTFHRVSQQYA